MSKQTRLTAMRSRRSPAGRVVSKHTGATSGLLVSGSPLRWRQTESPNLGSKMLPDPSDISPVRYGRVIKPFPLTKREFEIVRLIVQGQNTAAISEQLSIGNQTVKNHIHHIFIKLGVSDRLQLALYAVHNGLHECSENR